jgi:hypothetical protein
MARRLGHFTRPHAGAVAYRLTQHTARPPRVPPCHRHRLLSRLVHPRAGAVACCLGRLTCLRVRAIACSGEKKRKRLGEKLTVEEGREREKIEGARG